MSVSQIARCPCCGKLHDWIVDPLTGCWNWRRAVSSRYGVSYFDGKRTSAHRAVYLSLGHTIPPGHELHHICKNKICVNPAHLTPMSILDHRHLEPKGTQEQSTKTHCPKGHPYDEANTHWKQRGDTGRMFRSCRACARDAIREKRKGGPGKGSHQRAKTHCPHGHAYTPDNTYIATGGGRACLTCRRSRR